MGEGKGDMKLVGGVLEVICESAIAVELGDAICGERRLAGGVGETAAEVTVPAENSVAPGVKGLLIVDAGEVASGERPDSRGRLLGPVNALMSMSGFRWFTDLLELARECVEELTEAELPGRRGGMRVARGVLSSESLEEGGSSRAVWVEAPRVCRVFWCRSNFSGE